MSYMFSTVTVSSLVEMFQTVNLSVMQFACMLINDQQVQWWRHGNTLAACSRHAKLDDTSEASHSPLLKSYHREEPLSCSIRSTCHPRLALFEKL